MSVKVYETKSGEKSRTKPVVATALLALGLLSVFGTVLQSQLLDKQATTLQLESHDPSQGGRTDEKPRHADDARALALQRTRYPAKEVLRFPRANQLSRAEIEKIIKDAQVSETVGGAMSSEEYNALLVAMGSPFGVSPKQHKALVQQLDNEKPVPGKPRGYSISGDDGLLQPTAQLFPGKTLRECMEGGRRSRSHCHCRCRCPNSDAASHQPAARPAGDCEASYTPADHKHKIRQAAMVKGSKKKCETTFKQIHHDLQNLIDIVALTYSKIPQSIFERYMDFLTDVYKLLTQYTAIQDQNYTFCLKSMADVVLQALESLQQTPGMSLGKIIDLQDNILVLVKEAVEDICDLIQS